MRIYRPKHEVIAPSYVNGSIVDDLKIIDEYAKRVNDLRSMNYTLESVNPCEAWNMEIWVAPKDLDLDILNHAYKYQTFVRRIQIIINHDHGKLESYECYGTRSGDYVNGMIRNEGAEIVDFDGCFDIPTVLKDELLYLGFNID